MQSNTIKKLRDPINITLDEKHQKIELQVENNKSGWIIPATGGMGTILFTVVGLILMAVATFIFFRKKPVKKFLIYMFIIIEFRKEERHIAFLFSIFYP